LRQKKLPYERKPYGGGNQNAVLANKKLGFPKEEKKVLVGQASEKES